MGKDLSGQVVIVTGASSGIGRETALLFAREQARVALAVSREQQLQALEKEIQELGTEALSLICPVGTATEFFDAAKNTLGRKLAPKPPVQPSATVAKAIIRCAKSPRPEVIVFPPARLMVVLNALSPRLGDFVIRNMVSRKE